MGHLMRPMLYSTLSPLPHSKDGGDLLQQAFHRLMLSYHSGPTCLQPISDLMSFSFLELGLLQMKTAPRGFPLPLFFLFFLFVVIVVVVVVVDERFSPFVLSHFSWPAVSCHPRFAGKAACLDPHMTFHSRPRERLSLRSLQSASLLFSLFDWPRIPVVTFHRHRRPLRAMHAGRLTMRHFPHWPRRTFISSQSPPCRVIGDAGTAKDADEVVLRQ